MTEQKTADQDKAVDALNFPAGQLLFSADWGTIKLEISADYLEAVLLSLEQTSSRRAVTAEMINSLLRENKIVYGVSSGKISAVAAEVNKNSGWSGRMVIAAGRPPGIPGNVKFTFLGEEEQVWSMDGNVWQGNGVTLSFQALSEFFAAPGQPEAEVLAKAVRPGEVIAEREEPLKGRPGRDVYGRSIKAPRFKGLLAGENVEIVNLREFRATAFGYISILDKRLDVISPVRMADDEMTAWYINLPQLAPQRCPGHSDIIKALKKFGVISGAKKKAVNRLCQPDLPAGLARWYVVAQGREPVNGEEGRLDFTVSREKRIGDLNKDGSMDFRSLNLVQTVGKDSLVARKYPPTAGITGTTLLGKELPAEAGVDYRVEAGDNVRVEEENGIVNFYAECDGLILFRNNKISVDPLYRVSGDVDFSTGNIDVDCSLNIGGSVCSDFTVLASGNVVIGGGIEPSAKLTVQGDLLVQGGIIGEHTEVTVLGNLQADYIQAAKVVVKGNLVVKQYIYHAIIRTVGEIRVGPGSGKRGGSISGGTVCSSKKIVLSSSGSASNVPTALALASAPDKLARLNKLKKNIRLCDATISRIMRTMKLSRLDKDAIAQRFEPLSPEQKKLFSRILAKLKNTIDQKHRVKNNLEELQKEMRKELRKMVIKISHRCYGNTSIKIGKKEFLEKVDHGPAVFLYSNNRVQAEFGGQDDDLRF